MQPRLKMDGLYKLAFSAKIDTIRAQVEPVLRF